MVLQYWEGAQKPTEMLGQKAQTRSKFPKKHTLVQCKIKGNRPFPGAKSQRLGPGSRFIRTVCIQDHTLPHG